jgi:hypothetical protein
VKIRVLRDDLEWQVTCFLDSGYILPPPTDLTVIISLQLVKLHGRTCDNKVIVLADLCRNAASYVSIHRSDWPVDSIVPWNISVIVSGHSEGAGIAQSV